MGLPSFGPPESGPSSPFPRSYPRPHSAARRPARIRSGSTLACLLPGQLPSQVPGQRRGAHPLPPHRQARPFGPGAAERRGSRWAAGGHATPPGPPQPGPASFRRPGSGRVQSGQRSAEYIPVQGSSAPPGATEPPPEHRNSTAMTDPHPDQPLATPPRVTPRAATARAEDWITRKEAAALMGCSEDTVKRTVKAHGLATRAGANHTTLLRVGDLVAVGKLAAETLPASGTSAQTLAALRRAEAELAAAREQVAALAARLEERAAGVEQLSVQLAAKDKQIDALHRSLQHLSAAAARPGATA